MGKPINTEGHEETEKEAIRAGRRPMLSRKLERLGGGGGIVLRTKKSVDQLEEPPGKPR